MGLLTVSAYVFVYYPFGLIAKPPADVAKQQNRL